jgi:hypothetical protein
MRWLLFLSRLAFICGFCFILAFIPWTSNQDIAATIIIIGFVLGALVVPITLLCYIIVLLMRRNLSAIVPIWLVICNVLFLIALLVYIIIENVKNNNPV